MIVSVPYFYFDKSMDHAFTFDFDNSYFIKNLFFSYAIVWEKLPMDTTVQLCDMPTGRQTQQKFNSYFKAALKKNSISAHSDFKLFMGFIKAAFNAWKLTVNNVIKSEPTIVSPKIHPLMVVL